MTREELIAIGKHKVRRNEDLMLFYLQEFESIFGRKPICAGCTFNKDWEKFSLGRKSLNTFRKMEAKTFELNASSKNIIHTYYVSKSPRRKYGYNMTEGFAKEYLSNGTKEEIEERKKHFKTLPKVEKETAKVAFINIDDVEKVVYITLDGEQINLEDTTHKILNAYAKQEGIDFGDAKKVAEKRQVIAEWLK